VFRQASLSHRFAPFIQILKNGEQLKNSYLLGVQPQFVKEGGNLSLRVREALDKILECIAN
jgi:Ni,Fe-hydrogenase maturation factor